MNLINKFALKNININDLYFEMLEIYNSKFNLDKQDFYFYFYEMEIQNKRFPILVDEEGSTVSRLTNIYKNNFNSYYFGSLFKKNPKTVIIKEVNTIPL